MDLPGGQGRAETEQVSYLRRSSRCCCCCYYKLSLNVDNVDSSSDHPWLRTQDDADWSWRGDPGICSWRSSSTGGQNGEESQDIIFNV